MIKKFKIWLKCKIVGHHWEIYYCPDKKTFPLSSWVSGRIYKCVFCGKLGSIDMFKSDKKPV